MNNFKNKSIILFDGVCNLCNTSVNFIIKHDKKEHYLFASLQSDVAKEILLHFNKKNMRLNTIYLIEGNIIYEKSTAVLKISKKLNGSYPLIYGFNIIPKFIRDWIYDIIAINRYKWFGKQETCRLPSEKTKKRFL